MRRSGSNLSYFRNVASSFVQILLYYFKLWGGGCKSTISGQCVTVKVGFNGPDREQNCWFSHAKAQSISLTKFAHAIYREFFSDVKIEEKNP